MHVMRFSGYANIFFHEALSLLIKVEMRKKHKIRTVKVFLNFYGFGLYK